MERLLAPTHDATDATENFTGENEELLDLIYGCLDGSDNAREPLGYRQKVASAAADYIHAKFSEHFSMTTLCNALGARERTLYQGFQERYGMSPRAYLTMLRMNAARKTLLVASRESRVTEIALSTGFTHLGRFSMEYRRWFGEHPSQTLARGS